MPETAARVQPGMRPAPPGASAPGASAARGRPEAADAPGDARRGRGWHDLKLRVLSALVLVPIGVASIWAGGLVWWAACSVVFGGMAAEWAALCGAAAPRRAGVAALAAVLGAGVALTWVGLAVAAFVLALLSFALVASVRPVWLGVGTLYLGVALLAMLLLRGASGGALGMLFLAVSVWGSDIGAYAAGRAIGGARLAPSISPGKTWSGAAGGLACAMVVGAIFAAAAGRPAGPPAVLAGVLAVVSQAGDLLESAAKRRFGAKDSSRLIPGHGGLLDRLDGLLAAAPVALTLAWSGYGPAMGMAA